MTKRKDMLNIKQIRSGIGRPKKHRLILQGLGLRKINQVVQRPDTPEIRGMVAKIPHLAAIINKEDN